MEECDCDSSGEAKGVACVVACVIVKESEEDDLDLYR